MIYRCEKCKKTGIKLWIEDLSNLAEADVRCHSCLWFPESVPVSKFDSIEIALIINPYSRIAPWRPLVPVDLRLHVEDAEFNYDKIHPFHCSAGTPQEADVKRWKLLPRS